MQTQKLADKEKWEFHRLYLDNHMYVAELVDASRTFLKFCLQMVDSEST